MRASRRRRPARTFLLSQSTAAGGRLLLEELHYRNFLRAQPVECCEYCLFIYIIRVNGNSLSRLVKILKQFVSGQVLALLYYPGQSFVSNTNIMLYATFPPKVDIDSCAGDLHMLIA